MSNQNQSSFFRGIYEFEDPTGGLIAAKVPVAGSVDLYDGTALIVRPSQCAILVYKGQIADMFLAGTHRINTENVPILSRLANWRFGFENPLKCELIFLSGQIFTTRRWGTSQPLMIHFEEYGTIPIRAFGNFNLIVSDPKKFYLALMGTRSTYSVSDIEEYIQSEINQALPKVMRQFSKLDELANQYELMASKLESELKSKLSGYGLNVQKIQILSALPSQEILDAMNAKTAIQIIGGQKEYMLYKAATSLGQPGDNHGNDPLQMMMGLSLGKGLLGGVDSREKELALQNKSGPGFCSNCGQSLQSEAKFCAQCGKKV